MEDKFTAREVISLLEGLRRGFRPILEAVFCLREDMVGVKERLSAVEVRVASLDDSVRNFSRVESKLGF